MGHGLTPRLNALRSFYRNLTGQAGEHGLKNKICFACGEEKVIANKHHRISGFFTADRRLKLISVYP